MVSFETIAHRDASVKREVQLAQQGEERGALLGRERLLGPLARPAHPVGDDRRPQPRQQDRRRRRQGRPEAASIQQALLVGWCGMRGFVTLATAFALPPAFPQRDTAVLAAFSVVLFTLVVQGLTLAPLIRRLGLDGSDAARQELDHARAGLATVALATLSGHHDREAEHHRFVYSLDRQAAQAPAQASGDLPAFERYRRMGLIAIAAERKALETMRTGDRLGPDLYLRLQEELDWRELTLLPEQNRRIEES